MKLLKLTMTSTATALIFAVTLTGGAHAAIEITVPIDNWARAANLTMTGPANIVANATLPFTMRTGTYVASRPNQLIPIGKMFSIGSLAANRCIMSFPLGGGLCSWLFFSPVHWDIALSTNALGAVRLTASGAPVLTLLGVQVLISVGLQILCSGTADAAGNSSLFVSQLTLDPATYAQTFICSDLFTGTPMTRLALRGTLALQLGGFSFRLV